MKFLITLMLLLPSLGFAVEGKYFGKYKADVNADQSYDNGELEFLLRSNNEFTVLTDSWDRSVNLTSVYDLNTPHSYGPDMDTLVMSFEGGSDEDGITYTVELAWLGYEGSRELTIISNLMKYVDGPNGVYSVEKGQIRLYKWDKKSKEYKEIPSL